MPSKRKLLETMLESLPFPFYIIDPKTYRILLSNEASEKNIGKKCYEANHNRSTPCNEAGHPCGINKVLEEKRSVNTEHIHYDKTGNARDIKIHMHPVFDENGEVEEIIEYYEDITEQKQREQAQEQTAMELSAIYENVPFFLCVIDEQRRVIHANQFFSNLTGTPNSILFGESSKRTLGCLQEPDKQTFCEYGEDCEQCSIRIAVDATFRTGKSNYNIEKELHISSGNKTKNIILNGSTSLIRKDGNKRLLLCLQDVTEQYNNERLLRILSKAVEQSPVTVVITDTESKVQYINHEFTRTTGYTPEEVQGKRTNILKGPGKKKEEYQELWETILSGKSWHGTFHNRKKDGSLYWEEAVISPVKDKTGKITNFFALKENITRQKEMEDQLRLQARAIEESTSAVIITDATLPDNPIIYVNPSFEYITGYKSNEVIGRNCRFLQGKDNDQPGLDIIREDMAKGKSFQTLLRNYRKDGTVFWNDLKVTPLRDSSNRISHFVGILDDVTMLREVQGQLLMNEKRMRLSQEYASIGTGDWDIKTGEIHLSETLPPLFGLSKGAWQTTAKDFLRLIHPGDRQKVIRGIKLSLRGKSEYNIEFR